MNSPINATLSLLTFVPGGMGGTESYVRALLKSFENMPEINVSTIVPRSAAGTGKPSSETVVKEIRGGGATLDRVRTVAEASMRGRSIRRAMHGSDVVHYPFTAVVPRPPRGTPHVQSLHDLQHLDLPEFFTAADKAYRHFVYEGAARRADLVITISEFAKAGIVDRLGIAEERVVVTPLGVDLQTYRPYDGPRENFVLYPARGWPHKNHRRLVEAMQLVRQEHPDMRLVLTGGALESLEDLPEWVDRRGLVSSEELHELFRTASALAFPSLYEGFGLPPLEAMASGCPVAASNAGSIPEVVGDAGVLFDPMDPESIAHGILEAVRRGPELYEPGLERSRMFTWDACAALHLEAYRRAMGS